MTGNFIKGRSVYFLLTLPPCYAFDIPHHILFTVKRHHRRNRHELMSFDVGKGCSYSTLKSEIATTCRASC
ncbi:hypothetical protein B0T25DRAFT_161426 [Lasiosphaeria hispida]|uniref:Uncharacterized protein n=1 Tax=Lasiosphaeria hispida TaxID=260671 RepID=A0AAJ0HMA3_9PEZI|nr:hypothetical protein B0T25DRAFT_161426 [Lasiosphaeria hispida]